MTPKIDKIFRKVLSGELCANFGGPAGGARTLTGAEHLAELLHDSESLLRLKSNTGARGI